MMKAGRAAGRIAVLALCLALCPPLAGAESAPAARWIWLGEGNSVPADRNVYARFRTVLPAGADALRIAVSGTYAARVDGETVAFGQYTDFPERKTYTETLLAPSGRDRALEVDVWFSGDGFTSHCDGEPGLWAEIRRGREIVSASASGWLSSPMREYAMGGRKTISPSNNWTWEYDPAGAKYDFAPSRELVGCVMSQTPSRRPVEPCRIVRIAEGAVVNSGEGFTVFDIGEETAGLLEFEIESPSPAAVEIVHGEYLKDGRVPDCERKGSPRSVVDTYHAPEGASRYRHWLRRYGLRYAEFRSPVPGVRVRARVCVTELDGLGTPELATDDGDWRKIWDVSCRTLRCCLHEKYENCPWREQSICGYDARNQMLFGYCVWNDFSRAKAMIRLFGEAEKSHGFLPAAAPSRTGIVIPSFTFAWISSVCEYLEFSGDRELFLEQLPRIERMLSRILGYRKGELYTIPQSLDGASMIWNYLEPGELEYREDPPNAFYNLYLVEALSKLSAAMESAGLDGWRYRAAAGRIKNACEAYWDEGRGLYADSIGADGERKVFCGHVQALALANGIADPRRARRIIDALRGGTVELPELCAMMYLAKGVHECGDDDDRRWLDGRIKSIYLGMIERGATTWWESVRGSDYAGGLGSLCHGWSAMPVWYLRRIKGLSVK